MANARRRRTRNSRPAMYLLLILCGLLLLVLTGRQNVLKEVRVVREGAGGVAYISDEEIIRASGLKMGASIGAVSEMSETVERGVNDVGYVSFVSLERSGTTSVTLTVKNRVPCAVISSAGMYTLIDTEGYVMARLSELPTYEVLNVKGAELTEMLPGRLVATKRPSQFRDILKITRAINSCDAMSLISDLVIDNNEYRLITRPGLLVKFYIDDDLIEMIDIIRAFLNEGKTTGEVIISAGQAAYLPREGGYNDASTRPGM